MPRNRNKSTLELLMVNVLTEAKQALTLAEIVSKILESNPSALAGKTPRNSLYSVVYRREKRRKVALFNTFTRGGSTYYSLNPNRLNSIGDMVLKA